MNFIKKIALKDDIDRSVYPYNIPALKNFSELVIDSPVTFFVGENGSGKSTLIEAIAVAIGLNPEGGSDNFNFSTSSTHSELHEKIVLSKTGRTPSTKYFLRAESFYNVATEVDTLKAYGTHGGSLHKCSHGEAFIKLIENRFWDNGLFILDEPESALSPLKQMNLLILMSELVKSGSQLLIATHSPILLAFPNASIYDFDNNLEKVKYFDTEHYKLYKLFLDNPELMVKKLFDE